MTITLNTIMDKADFLSQLYPFFRNLLSKCCGEFYYISNDSVVNLVMTSRIAILSENEFLISTPDNKPLFWVVQHEDKFTVHDALYAKPKPKGSRVTL